MNKAALYQKIVNVMKDVGQLQKDGDIINDKGAKMYSYLSEEQTTGELQKAFVTYGLVLFPIKVDSEIVYLESMRYDKEVKTPITKVIVTYKICDSETGESEELQSIGYGSDSQDKGSNKAMTGAFKYVQRQTFMISTGDDGDHTPNELLDKQTAPQKTTQAAPTHQQSRNTDLNNDDLAAIAGASNEQYGGPSYINEGQAKMLFAKWKSSQYGNDKSVALELISAHLGKIVSDFKFVEKSDINKAIKWLDEHKAA